MKPHQGRKWRLGDRRDGYKVRNLDPMSIVVPHIMPKTYDAWVLFEDKVDITHTEEFIREQRAGAMPNLTMYQIIFAAIERALVEIPELNRFCIHRRVYSRKMIRGSMVVMKGMQRDSDRTIILPEFECEDTLQDVVKRIEEATGEIDKTTKVRDDENKNDFDIVETALSILPRFILAGAVGLLKIMDYFGIMPKAIHKVSPFHSSFFLTNMGSIGLDAVYHHIYQFGTVSIFGAIGRKEGYCELQPDGSVKKGTRLKLQFVVDERAADGYIYALGFRRIRTYIMHPEKLLTPPEHIEFDKIDRVKNNAEKPVEVQNDSGQNIDE